MSSADSEANLSEEWNSPSSSQRATTRARERQERLTEALADLNFTTPPTFTAEPVAPSPPNHQPASTTERRESMWQHINEMVERLRINAETAQLRRDADAVSTASANSIDTLARIQSTDSRREEVPYYTHEIVCNALRTVPPGGPGCSCCDATRGARIRIRRIQLITAFTRIFQTETHAGEYILSMFDGNPAYLAQAIANVSNLFHDHRSVEVLGHEARNALRAFQGVEHEHELPYPDVSRAITELRACSTRLASIHQSRTDTEREPLQQLTERHWTPSCTAISVRFRLSGGAAPLLIITDAMTDFQYTFPPRALRTDMAELTSLARGVCSRFIGREYAVIPAYMAGMLSEADKTAIPEIFTDAVLAIFDRWHTDRSNYHAQQTSSQLTTAAEARSARPARTIRIRD